MSTVIFDLDGTLANIDHRRHFVEGNHKNFDVFFKACVHDSPNPMVIDLFNYYHTVCMYRVLILSGRSDIVRDETIDWLSRHTTMHKSIISKNLLMRSDGDYTPDVELKKSWVDLYQLSPENVKLVVDDRQKVVDMWRSLGFECWQVAKGDF